MSDPIMDAGAWRREALGLRERVRELEEALLAMQSDRDLVLLGADCDVYRAAERFDHARFMAAGWRRLAALQESPLLPRLAHARAEAKHWRTAHTEEVRKKRAGHAAQEARIADLRAEREALYAVVRAARVACESVWVKDHVPLRAALDALPCWCGKPDGHAEGCPRG